MSSTVDRQAFAVRLTGYEVSEEAVMPIRVRSRGMDCWIARNRRNIRKGARHGAAFLSVIGGKKTKLRVFCGSFQLLLGWRNDDSVGTDQDHYKYREQDAE